MADKKLFCFGFGYAAYHLARTLQAEGWRVAGTTRDREKKDALRAHGVEAFCMDDDKPLGDPLYLLRDTTHVLLSIPPDDAGDPVYRMHGGDLVRTANISWVGYLSSTAVYGDRQGQQVDETAELRPSSKRGSRRLRAENQWRTLYEQAALPVHIFRLAGIYGPGRNVLDSVRAGIARRIDKPGHAFSRIHIDDIVTTILASIAQPNPGAAYNLSDDRPAPSHEVIAHACALLGLKPPPLIPFAEADLAPITLSFYSDNKRVINTRIKKELGIKLQYPSYVEGLDACLAAEKMHSGEAEWLMSTAQAGLRE